MKMDMNQVLHMKSGSGEDSYAQNSAIQNDILSITKSYTEQALVKVLLSSCCVGGSTEGKIGIADLGCSSGPNALAATSHMLEVVYATWKKKGVKSPVVAAYLNDLPGNDFNNVFGSLPGFFDKLREKTGHEFKQCFVFGAPGSFYGGLFPTRSLHFVHSSSSLHWLSEVPRGLDPDSRPTMNNGKINISKTSSKSVMEAYKMQFERDFKLFLESRSKEVVEEGRMVLSFMGRISIDLKEEEDTYLQWELIAQSLMALVSEGKVEEEKVDSFNTPYYAACPKEIKHLVQTQGSFVIESLWPFELNWDGFHETESTKSNSDEEVINGYGPNKKASRGERIARIHRAVLEPMFEHHFGMSIMDELFCRYSVMLDSYLSTREPKFINLIVTLVRKPTPSS
ncbi:hypothetical protein V2J09_007202 [Rumex salicifolius]